MPCWIAQRKGRITCVKPAHTFPERQIVKISGVGIVHQRSDPMRDAPLQRGLQRIVVSPISLISACTVEKVLVPNLPPLAECTRRLVEPVLALPVLFDRPRVIVLRLQNVNAVRAHVREPPNHRCSQLLLDRQVPLILGRHVVRADWDRR